MTTSFKTSHHDCINRSEAWPIMGIIMAQDGPDLRFNVPSQTLTNDHDGYRCLSPASYLSESLRSCRASHSSRPALGQVVKPRHNVREKCGGSFCCFWYGMVFSRIFQEPKVLEKVQQRISPPQSWQSNALVV
jgi:hypothetical protein